MSEPSSEATPQATPTAAHEQLSLEAIAEPASMVRDPEIDHEVGRLEKLLAERGRTFLAQRAETRELRAVLRDLLAQLAATTPTSSGEDRDPVALRARTIEAEVGRIEAQLKLDEAVGQLAASRNAAAERDRLLRVEAELSGRERGLRAALAEAEESRDVAQARVMLLEQDRTAGDEARLTLTRELNESREHLELQHARLHDLSTRFDGGLERGAADALQAELAGTRARGDEMELAARSLQTRLTAAEHDAHEQRDLLGTVRVELSARQADHREAATRLEQLQRTLAREIELAHEQLSHASARESDYKHRVGSLRDALHETRAALLTAQSQLEQMTAGDGTLDAAPRDLPTEPGMPFAVEAMDALESQVASRNDHIARLERRLRELSYALHAITPGATLDAAQLQQLRTLASE